MAAPEFAPYSPPAANLEPTAPKCPYCQAELERGDLVSSSRINWRAEATSFLRRLLLPGRPVGKTKWGLGYRVPAFHCPSCRLYVLR